MLDNNVTQIIVAIVGAIILLAIGSSTIKRLFGFDIINITISSEWVGMLALFVLWPIGIFVGVLTLAVLPFLFVFSLLSGASLLSASGGSSSSGRKGKAGVEADVDRARQALENELSIINRTYHFQRKLVNRDLPAIFGNEWEILQQDLNKTLTVLDAPDPQDTAAAARQLTQPWSAMQALQPRKSGLGAPVIRIGEVKLPLITGVMETLPALMPLLTKPSPTSGKEGVDSNSSGHLAIFTYSPERRVQALRALQSAAMRVMLGFPVRKARFTFIDPVGMGDNFPFKRVPNLISGPKTYTRNDDIRIQLRALTEHVEQIVQKYLARDYVNIEAFNEDAKSVREAYRFLFIADFPAGFDPPALEDLKKLIANGPRAGVYVFLHIDGTRKPPHDFPYDALREMATVIEVGVPKNPNEYNPYVRDPRDAETARLEALRNAEQAQTPLMFTLPRKWQSVCWFSVPVVLDNPPEDAQFNALVERITVASKEDQPDHLPFAELRPQELWQGDSSFEICVPIGKSGAMDDLEFWLGQRRDSSNQEIITNHALLAGKSGAGKSVTLHTIICNLALKYAPEQLQLYLLDYKEGVEFQDYVQGKDERGQVVPRFLPHARVVSIESEREFGISVLRALQAEFSRRGTLFKEAGNVSSLGQYRSAVPDQILPRILLIIDEFQVLFSEDDAISSEANRIIEQIGRQGRSAGIHMLLATQSPNITYFSKACYSQIDLRMVLQIDKGGAAAALAEGNADAVDLLERPGEILYNNQSGKKDFNQYGQIAKSDAQGRREVLNDINKQAQLSRGTNGYPIPIVFRGNEAARLNENNQLLRLVQQPQWNVVPTNRAGDAQRWRDFFNDPQWIDAEKPGVAWVGEGIRIGPHAAAIFRRRERSNLVIVGEDEQSAFGMMGGMLASLAALRSPQEAEFCIIDLSPEEEEWSDVAEDVARSFPHQVLVGEAHSADKEGLRVERAVTIMEQVGEMLERRKQQRDAGEDERSFKSVYLFIGGLHRFHQMRPVAGERRDELSPVAKILFNLITQGSELGIHVIVWVDRIATTFDRLTLKETRRWLTYFDLRIALTVPPEDSRALFESDAASKLPRLRAYLRDEAAPTELQKFKPYYLFSRAMWLELGQKLKKRSG